MTDAELRQRYPEIPWDRPISVGQMRHPLQIFSRTKGKHWHCRYCIAYKGLKHSELSERGRTHAEVEQHIAEDHPQ